MTGLRPEERCWKLDGTLDLRERTAVSSVCEEERAGPPSHDPRSQRSGTWPGRPNGCHEEFAPKFGGSLNSVTSRDYTAFQRPMTDVFDIRSSAKWTYTAEASPVLATTMLALSEQKDGARYATGPVIAPRHDAAYWEAATAGFDFSEADQVPPALFNRVLWAGLMGSKPYPVVRSGQTQEAKID
jgi:hypothetical protein